MAFKFDDSYIGAARAFGKKAREAKAAGDDDQARAMMANKASSAIGGALTAVNGVTGILNTALQSANIQDTSQYEGQIDLLSQAGNRNYYDYGQLAEDMSNTDFSVNTDYDAIRGMGGKGVTKEKVGAVGSSTLNGAMTGLQVGGPWGAAIGAVVGAGSAIGGILAGDQKARIQQGFLDANADRATTDAMLNFNAGLEEIGNRRNRFNLANYAAKGGQIEIKKENEGKFTAAAKRHNMTVQEFAKHVLAKKNANKYSATMRKRANFARNAAGWKHAEGGPIDYSGITTTNNRPYNTDYISYIDTSMRKGGLNDYQRAAVLANIIEESGGNPFAEGPGGFYGLLQWSGTRYPKTKEKDVYKEIDNQVANILSTAKNSTDKMSWTHGGKGSGYNSLTDAMKAYNGKTLDEVMKGYTLGYVRPAAGVNAYNNRLKVAEQLYNLEGFTQHAEGGGLNTSDRNLAIKSGEHNTYGFGDYLNRKAKNVIRLLIDPEARRAEHYNNTYTFEEAYKDARSKGQKTFFWNGNYYNTDYEGAHGRQYKEDIASGKVSAWREAYPGYLNPELRKEKEEELATYGITNEQTQNKTTLSERALKNLDFYGDYDFKQGFDALVLNNKQRTEPNNSPRNATHYQQLRYYLGYPLQHEEITTTKAIGAPVHISKYTPALGNNNTEYYYTFARNPYGNEGLTNNTYRQKYERLKAQTDDYLKHGFYDDAAAFGLDYAEKKANDSTKKWSDYFDKHAAELRNFSRLENYIPATYQGRFETRDYGNVTGVGNFTQYGTPEYRSFYDLWDIGLGQGNNTKTFGLGKPYEFYDRRYHDKDKQNVPDPDIDSLYENFQYAEGGELNTSNMNTYNTHGGYFNPGLISIDAGGTHEQNPNGGVQMGVDSQGIPNLVEEGETVYDDYVFSDRLKPSASELKKFNLPEKHVGKTFAELSDVLGEEAKERPNDAISNDGLGVMLDRLIACQEAHKQAQEERAMKRELSKMSPEELVALGAQLQQMSDQQAMAQQGMQQYMPQMEAPIMQQMPVDDQSQMIMPEQQPMMADGGLLHVYKNGTDDKDNSDTKVGYPRYDYGFNLPLPMHNYRVYRHWYPSYAQDFSSLGNIDIPSFSVDLGPRFDYGAGLVTNPSDLNIGYGNYRMYRTNGQTSTQSAPAAGNDGTLSSGSAGTASTSSPVVARPSFGLPDVAPITGSAVDTDARLRRRGFGLTRLPGITPEGYESTATASGMQPGDSPFVTSLAGAQVDNTDASDSTQLLPTVGRYAGAAGNVLSALDIALQSPDRVRWNRIQPNYVAGNLDLQKMRYTPIDWQIGANQVNANAAATRRAINNAGVGPAVGATLLAANYGNNQNLGNVINQTQLANDQRRAQTIGVNNQAENLMRNFDFRRNAMNTQIANQFAQYNNQLDMDETLRNIQFENDKYAALSHAISNSLNDMSNIGRENFVMNQINSNAALYYGVGANGWAYYKGYDGVDWKLDPQSGRRVPVTDKSEIPATQQKHGGMLKKYKGC